MTQQALFASLEFTGICEFCGETSALPFVFNINHRPQGSTGLCTTQSLVRAHLISATRQGKDPSQEITRAREFRLDPDQIITEALAELPDLCLGCRHNKKPPNGDYCASTPCQQKAATT